MLRYDLEAEEEYGDYRANLAFIRISHVRQIDQEEEIDFKMKY